MTSELPLRRATVTDAPEIVRLGEFMYASVGIPADDAWRGSALAQVERRLASDDAWGWCVDDPAARGRLAASAFLLQSTRLAPPGQRADWRGYVQWVATDPAYQGRGLARRLMRAVMEFATERGAEVVELHSSPQGRALYESLGFEPHPRVDYPPDVRGVPMVWRVTRGGVGGHA